MILATLSLLVPGTLLEGEEPRWSETGTRAAYIDTTSGTFRQFELYADRPIGLRFDLSENWKVTTHWDLSAGYLTHEDRGSLVVAAGPVAVLGRNDRSWFLEAGSRPTLISRHDFDQKEFGGPFQFTSHAALGWRWKQLELAYRIQHMSNARIYSKNDGLNLHVLQIGWRFGPERLSAFP